MNNFVKTALSLGRVGGGRTRSRPMVPDRLADLDVGSGDALGLGIGSIGTKATVVGSQPVCIVSGRGMAQA